MKKILFIIGMLLSFVLVQAQTFGTPDKWVPTEGGTVGTTTSANAYGATAATYTWGVAVPGPYYYNLQLKLADVSAISTANTASCVLKGSVDGTTFKTITTVAYAAGGTDTTIFYQSTTNYPNYRYLQISVTPSDSIKVDRKLLKITPVYP
jgi:hypothetical protein